MKIIKIILRGAAAITGLFALFLWTQNLWATSKFSNLPDNNIVRVAVLSAVPQGEVSIRGIYQLVEPVSGKILMEGRRLRATWIKAGTDGIVLEGQSLHLRRVRFLTSMDVSITIKNNERRYRGAIDIIQDPKGTLTIVNRVDLEDYIKGVLYHEISHRWPMEVLKAQAVASRSYAMYQMKANAQRDFDVTSDIYSQVYGGKTGERYRTNLAVEYTHREILVYQGKILPAYFHATCGGYTEDVQELWKNVNMAPLRGERCGFCLVSPHYWWQKNYRSKDIQDKLNAAGYKIGLIKDISVVDRDRSGRIRLVQLTGRDGEKITLPGKDFRQIIGPNDIRSNNYRIEMKGYYFDLVGKGWGHGVGLCQWGAYGMALQRYTCREILSQYYPGAQIMDYRDL